MATISKVLFYLDDPSAFPMEMSYTDLLGNTGISSSDGYTLIPELQSSNPPVLRIVNFAPPVSSPSSKFGSILGICFVYDNGVKSWVKQIVSRSASSANLDVAIGPWVDGLTHAQARAHTNYQKPYIGYATQIDYAEYEIEVYQDPPPPHIPLDGIIRPSTAEVRIGSTVNFTITLSGSNQAISKYEWKYTSVVTGSETNLSASLRFPVQGTYVIEYAVENSIGEKFTTSATVVVLPPADITVDIDQPSAQVFKGESVSLTRTVVSLAPIIKQEWIIPTGVTVQSKAPEKVILVFDRLGTYMIRYTAENNEGSSGEDFITITVVEPPKKKIGIALFLEKESGEVEVNPSVTLNDHGINPDEITLMFRNTGESTWLTESFLVEVGQGSLYFFGGTSRIETNVSIDPGQSFKCKALIMDFDQARAYSFVIKAIVKDKEGQSLTRYYELRWMAGKKPEYAFEVAERNDDIYKYPSVMKRNARYRGPRESEKYLGDHQEEIHDIRQGYIDIKKTTNLQDNTVKSWFSGENEDPFEKITYSGAKVFQVFPQQTSYPLLPGVDESSFSDLMISLNGAIITSPQDYLLRSGYIVLGDSVNKTGELKAEFTVTEDVKEQRMIGTNENMNQLERINAKLSVMERRFNRHENAYQ